jgi:hypothetical protein
LHIKYIKKNPTKGELQLQCIEEEAERKNERFPGAMTLLSLHLFCRNELKTWNHIVYHSLQNLRQTIQEEYREVVERRIFTGQ